MSEITIHYPDEAKLCNRLQQFVQRVRERAHSLFEKRQRQDGRALDDWLQAEQELLFSPETVIEDRDGEVRLTVNLGDLKPMEIHVDARADSILLTAEHRENSGGDLVEKECTAQFNLPDGIDPNKVTAELHGGHLEITATKRQ